MHAIAWWQRTRSGLTALVAFALAASSVPGLTFADNTTYVAFAIGALLGWQVVWGGSRSTRRERQSVGGVRIERKKDDAHRKPRREPGDQ